MCFLTQTTHRTVDVVSDVTAEHFVHILATSLPLINVALHFGFFLFYFLMLLNKIQPVIMLPPQYNWKTVKVEYGFR